MVKVQGKVIEAKITKAKIMKSKTNAVAEDMFIVGEITGTHGVRGIVKVMSLTDFPELRFKVGNEIYVEKLGKKVKILSASQHKGLYLVGLEGITDYDMGHALLHTYMKINKSELAPLADGEFYQYQIIGLEVFDNGEMVGTVREIMETGANDVYILDAVEGFAPNGKEIKEILLPVIPSCVLKIDPENNRMDVKIPEGLLD